MRTRKATLNKKLMGLDMIPFPVRAFRTMGIRMRMNAAGRSHSMPNKTMGKPSWKLRLFTTSRIVNGNTRIELMIAGSLRFTRRLFIKVDPGPAALYFS
jgi:hypothetical protein